ncbi:MAG: hypothetical protein AABX23_00225 [Nanoarchaeota archaeon]
MQKFNKELVADSTFYIFFIEDSKNSNLLCKILNSFKAHISPTIYDELKMKSRDQELNSIINNKCNIFKDSRIKYSEALRPVFSKEELKKGEHEIIAIAVLCDQMVIDFVLVIDDEGPRKIINSHFKYLLTRLVRTARFIEQCYSKYDIFENGESIKLLNDMKSSKFRIDDKSIEQLLKELEK